MLIKTSNPLSKAISTYVVIDMSEKKINTLRLDFYITVFNSLPNFMPKSASVKNLSWVSTVFAVSFIERPVSLSKTIIAVKEKAKPQVPTN